MRGANASSTSKVSDLSQSSGERRNSESGELIPQDEREFRRFRRERMLIGDPLGEGSNASSTNSELWGAEDLSLRMRGNSDAPKGAAGS